MTSIVDVDPSHTSGIIGLALAVGGVGLAVHVVLDNLSAHKAPEITK